MATIREHVWLKASADSVWNLVGDSMAIQEWVPSISSSSMNGSTRTLVLKRGGSVTEKIITLNSTMRRIQYSVIEGLPVRDHLGTVDIIEVDSGSCILIYSTDVQPDTVAPAISNSINASLRILEKRFGIAHVEGE